MTAVELGPAEDAVRAAEWLAGVLGLEAGDRVLEVGCGTGAHSVALASAGYAVTGVDSSAAALQTAAERARAARAHASFFEVDPPRMPFDDEFDATLSLWPGAFGAFGPDDTLVLKRMAEALVVGGRAVVTVPSGYNIARREGADSDLDLRAGTLHYLGRTVGVYTPRELALAAVGVGLVPEAVWGVGPDAYGRRKPRLRHSELLLVARRPG